MAEKFFEVRDLEVKYGDIQVIWKESFYVNRGEIVALYILPAYYGTGLGQALLDAACERLTGYGRIRLDVLEKNARAIRFYEKNGFVPDGRRTESPSLGAVVIGMSRKGI